MLIGTHAVIYSAKPDADRKFLHESQAAWGLLTTVHLPGAGKLGVYQPKHHRP